MKKQDIFEKSSGKVVKSCEISVLGFKETLDLCQATSSKFYKIDCCRSLSFGWV